MTTELKTFIEDKDGFITHVTVNGETPEQAWQDFLLVVGWFKDEGAKPNKGFENKVVRGGGGKKPEDPIPADLKDHVPAHCGEAMKYAAAYTNPNTQQKVGAKFQCAKGGECANARTVGDKKYGATIWEDAYRKELAMDGVLVA